MPTPYQLYSWVGPHQEHSIDTIRAEDAFSSKLGYEEHIPGQTRDWNEELQTTRELPRKNLPERLLRERAIFKVNRIRKTDTQSFCRSTPTSSRPPPAAPWPSSTVT